MLKSLAEWAVRKIVVRVLGERLSNLEKSVSLAESMLKASPERLQRILISSGGLVVISGSDDEIAAAAAKLAHETKSCVTVAVAISQYHRRDCEEVKGGGAVTVGN